MPVVQNNLFEAIVPPDDQLSIESVAEALLKNFKDQKIWILEGGLGTGKTTLVQAICKVLGVSDTVSSPTFNIVHSYPTSNNTEIHHIDLYRLSTKKEVFEIGLQEYLHDSEYCFIEWGNLFSELIDVPYVHVIIEIELNLNRKIKARYHEN